VQVDTAGDGNVEGVAEPGQHLFDELQWVHEKIRRDLAVCQEPARRVAEGLSPIEVRAEIRELQTNSPRWRLRVNCLYSCRFVHSHHHPSMVPVADKLEADRRVVSGGTI
jgi:hypothetical protein